MKFFKSKYFWFGLILFFILSEIVGPKLGFDFSITSRLLR